MKPAIAHWMVWFGPHWPYACTALIRPPTTKGQKLFYHLNSRHTERPF